MKDILNEGKEANQAPTDSTAASNSTACNDSMTDQINYYNNKIRNFFQERNSKRIKNKLPMLDMESVKRYSPY
jgi:hypothetical protein